MEVMKEKAHAKVTLPITRKIVGNKYEDEVKERVKKRYTS